jgi:hypothetical protein
MNGSEYLRQDAARRAREEREGQISDKQFQQDCRSVDIELNQGREGRRRKAVRVDCPELFDWLVSTGLLCHVAFIGYMPGTGRLRSATGYPYRDFTKHYILMVRRPSVWSNTAQKITVPEVTVTFPFQQGSAFGGNPTVTGILQSVAMDCRSRDDYTDAGHFIDDMGFESAGQALSAFHAMTKEREDVHSLLTPEQYKQFLELSEDR